MAGNIKKDIAKSIALGINQYRTMTDKIKFVENVLDSYNLALEKSKDASKGKFTVPDIVMGKHTETKASLQNEEEMDR